MIWLRRLAIVLFYLIVTLVALNALAIHFTTAMPGTVVMQPRNDIQPSEFDIFLWDIWWVKHAVFDLHVSPLYTNSIVYPVTSPLAGHTLALLWGLASAPFQMLFGLIPTYNGIIVLAFVLAGVCLYAFVRRHVQRQSVALLAGLIFAFTPAMLQRASVGHLDKLSIFWLPLCLLLWDKTIETRRWTWAVITGLCLYLSWLTDFQQAMWTLLLLAPYIIYTLTLHPLPSRVRVAAGRLAARERDGVRVSLLIALTFSAFLVPALFAPLPQLIEANQLNYPPASLEDTASFAFPLQNLLIGSTNGDFTVGLLLPLLTVISIPFIRRDGERWFWLLVALGCLVVALGPYAEAGGARIELPYALVHRLLGNQYRTPMRFMTPAVLAMTMVVSLTLDRSVFAWKRLAQRVNIQRTLVTGLMLAFVWDYRLLQPFPITLMPNYQAYHTIAQMPGEFTVLDVPVGVRTGFAVVGRGEYLQYYAPVHQHPIPSGYLSRLPNEVLDFFYHDPLLGALTLSQALPPQAEVDARLSQLIQDWKIGYVVLHRDLLEKGRIKSLGDLLNRQPLLEKIGEEGPLVIYKARGN